MSSSPSVDNSNNLSSIVTNTTGFASHNLGFSNLGVRHPEPAVSDNHNITNHSIEGLPLPPYYWLPPPSLDYDTSIGQYSDDSSASSPPSLPFLPSPRSLSSSPTPPPVHLIMSTAPRLPQTPSPASNSNPGRPRSKFTSADLKAIMSVVVDVNPYMAKHGKKGQMWKDIAEKVKGMGKCLTHSETTIKKKVDALLSYHEVCWLFILSCSSLTCL